MGIVGQRIQEKIGQLLPRLMLLRRCARRKNQPIGIYVARLRLAAQIADGLQEDPEAVYHVLRHFAANDPSLHLTLQSGPAEDTFKA